MRARVNQPAAQVKQQSANKSAENGGQRHEMLARCVGQLLERRSKLVGRSTVLYWDESLPSAKQVATAAQQRSKSWPPVDAVAPLLSRKRATRRTSPKTLPGECLSLAMLCCCIIITINKLIIWRQDRRAMCKSQLTVSELFVCGQIV